MFCLRLMVTSTIIDEMSDLLGVAAPLPLCACDIRLGTLIRMLYIEGHTVETELHSFHEAHGLVHYRGETLGLAVFPTRDWRKL